ncbi:MAG: cation transporter [Limnochordaceae bacterium]|nr:cation transporter [Limnochordaceae bacterium]
MVQDTKAQQGREQHETPATIAPLAAMPSNGHSAGLIRTPDPTLATPPPNHDPHPVRRLTLAGIVVAVVLLALKAWAAFRSGSISILSDALNSFLDVFSYSAIHVAVRMQNAAPDVDHPFGHRRAEPLAGLVIAILASVLGFNILNDSVTSLLSPHEVSMSTAALAVMVVAIGTKIVMAALYWRAARSGSPALEASFVDTRNDIFASSVALSGFLVGGHWDSAAAMVVGIWIIYSGVRVGLENIHYLMGRAPAPAIQESIRQAAASVPGVIKVNFLRAHYVGDRVDAELHINVDQALSLRQAHDISEAVRQQVEALPDLQYAFVHLDPVAARPSESQGTEERNAQESARNGGRCLVPRTTTPAGRGRPQPQGEK